MKRYPTIPKQIRTDIPLYVFDKLDGSNIRAEWSKKRGFYKFGSRKMMIDETDLLLGEAPGLVVEKYEEGISNAMKKAGLERGVFFFEFLGENSFAGWHADEEHDVTLFDANIYKRGMLPPDEFLKLFGDLDIPELLHRGKINLEFVEKVRESSLEGITFEGVVCKARNPKKSNPKPLMFKIKTRAWLDSLKVRCGDDEELFEKLA